MVYICLLLNVTSVFAILYTKCNHSMHLLLLFPLSPSKSVVRYHLVTTLGNWKCLILQY